MKVGDDLSFALLSKEYINNYNKVKYLLNYKISYSNRLNQTDNKSHISVIIVGMQTNLKD